VFFDYFAQGGVRLEQCELPHYTV